jgi:hypothetical protein
MMAPAALLGEWLAVRGMSPQSLAIACACHDMADETYLVALERIRGVLDRQPYGDDTAEMLGRGTSASAHTWRNAERLYRDGLAAGKTDVTDWMGR